MAENFFGLLRCERETRFLEGFCQNISMNFKHPFYFSWNVMRIESFWIVCPSGWIFALGTGQYLSTLHQQIATMVVLTSHCQGCLLPPPWCCYMQHSWTSALKLLKEADILFCLYQNLVEIKIREKKVYSLFFWVLLPSWYILKCTAINHMLLQYASKFWRGVGVKLERRRKKYRTSFMSWSAMEMVPGVQWKCSCAE